MYDSRAPKVITGSIDLILNDVTIKPRDALFKSARKNGFTKEEAQEFSVKASKVTGSKRLKKMAKDAKVGDITLNKLVVNASTSVSSLLSQVRKEKGYIPKTVSKAVKSAESKSDRTKALVQEAKLKNMKQTEVAQYLEMGLSTVKRYWN
ncbi:hypothetical protein AB4331_02365 [Vibrio breoganii]